MEEVSSMPSSSQEFCLRWNNFHSSLISALDGFKNDLDFVDVTLACEGQFLKAHKMLLSACSVFFRDLLKANPCPHPIIILPSEVRFIDLEKILRFVYQGEVNVQQEHLARFLKAAEMLKIRGLAEDSEKQKVLHSSPRPLDSGIERITDIAASPKRPRLSVEGQCSTCMEAPQTPNDDGRQSRSGADSDSEMIPVKQEMVELKECDFDSEVDTDILLQESNLRESPIATTSSNVSLSTQALKSHPSAPPPPGPLLPSYVPPPQVKAPDESSTPQNQEDSLQGCSIRRSIDDESLSHVSNGEDLLINIKWSPGRTPKTTNVPKTCLSRGQICSDVQSPPFLTSLAESPTSTSTPISICGERCSVTPMDIPGDAAQTPSSDPPTGSSKATWHPPHNGDSSLNLSLNIPPTLHPTSSISNHPTMACDICLKTFTSRSNLNKHKRVQHSGEEYLCPICQRRFRSRYYIKDHVNLCAAGQGKRIQGQGGSHQGTFSAEEIDEVNPSISRGESKLFPFELSDEKIKFEEWAPNLFREGESSKGSEDDKQRRKSS